MSVEITDVVALSGAPGLHQVVKADDRAIVIESLDGKKKRQLIKGNMLISKLTDISIYTDEDSTPLVEVLKAVQDKYGNDIPVSKKSSNNELLDFLGEILPTFDRERVYPSNVKKMLSWYRILLENEIDMVIPEDAEGNSEETAPASEESAASEEA